MYSRASSPVSCQSCQSGQPGQSPPASPSSWHPLTKLSISVKTKIFTSTSLEFPAKSREQVTSAYIASPLSTPAFFPFLPFPPPVTPFRAVNNLDQPYVCS